MKVIGKQMAMPNRIDGKRLGGKLGRRAARLSFKASGIAAASLLVLGF
jgi:hypothetical protein